MITRMILPVILALAVGACRVEADTLPKRIEGSRVENLFLVAPGILSGATPETEAAFAELQRNGVKTIISVDGAKPDVATAGKYGMRYVHLPFGYDGISTNRQLELVKAAKTLPQPIFVHCHHGEHRGPTAAAILCMGALNWDAKQGIEWLKKAGTSANYSGLYKTVEQFRMPDEATLEKLAGDFSSQAKVSSMVEAMVGMDERMSHLKAIRQAGYKVPELHPDIVPANEALLLHELFKELLRSPEMKDKNPEFLDELKQGEQATGKFFEILKRESLDPAEAENAFKAITQNCSSCHKKFRN